MHFWRNVNICYITTLFEGHAVFRTITMIFMFGKCHFVLCLYKWGGYIMSKVSSHLETPRARQGRGRSLWESCSLRMILRHPFLLASCIILTILTWKLHTNMHRFLMSSKVTFLSCLIKTIWTLKLFPIMNCMCMNSKASLLTGLMST